MKIKTFAIYCFIALINVYSITSNKIENKYNLKKNYNEKFSSGSNNESEMNKNSIERPDLNINFNTHFMIQITSKGSIITNTQNETGTKKIEENSKDKTPSENLKKDKFAASNNNQKNNNPSPSLDMDKAKEKVFIDDFSKSGKIVCSNENCRSPNVCNESKDSCLCAFENAEVFSMTNLNKYDNNYSLNSFESKINNKRNENQNYVYCEYRRKHKKIYLLLELFFNLGIGHFYVGNLQKANLKLIILSLPWVILAFLLIKRKVNLDDNKEKLKGLPILFYFLWVFWWLYDLVYIFTGNFKDENGVSVI